MSPGKQRVSQCLEAMTDFCCDIRKKHLPLLEECLEAMKLTFMLSSKGMFSRIQTGSDGNDTCLLNLSERLFVTAACFPTESSGVCQTGRQHLQSGTQGPQLSPAGFYFAFIVSREREEGKHQS